MRNNTHLKGNAAQIRAIEHVNGPALVVAGPGSGKTFVIIQRVRHLIEEASIDPGNILVITFTKAAALEMQHRFFKLTDSGYPEVAFGTFHSIFYNILRISGNMNDIHLISEIEKYKLIDNILKNVKYSNNLKDDISADVIANILSEISRIKNEGDLCFRTNESIPFRDYFEQIFKEYHKQLKELNKIDFDDMIFKSYDFLKSNPQILSKWQERFKYILVDEAQDINNSQWLLIKLLTSKNNNLFMVGDDDQSIYGFRGSKPEILMNFKDSFKDCELILLNINYRCASNILKDSLVVINDNKNRIKKDIKAGSDQTGQVDYISQNDTITESESIEAFIKRHKNEENNIAILCRTNRAVYQMTQFLMSRGINCAVNLKIDSVYNDRYIKDILAYLRFAFIEKSRKDFLMIMNKPVRYIKRDALKSEIVLEKDLIRYYQGNIQMQSVIQRLFRDLDRISNFQPFLAIKYIRTIIGYDKFALTDKDEEARNHILTVLDQFEIKAREYKDFDSFFAYINDYNSKIELENKKLKKSGNKSGVKLMTFHASKGLEFDYVLIPDVNEGLIPGRRAITDADMEEERRMFYVAMTRAKKELHIFYLTGSKENAMMPSRFIKKLIKQRVTTI